MDRKGNAMNPVETIKHNGKTIELYYDEDAQNPRRDFDPLGHMVCFHKRYDLGDKQDKYSSQDFNSWEEMEAKITKQEKVAVILPIYMYDHSGLTINTTGFSCPWDSGQIGFIYITREEVAKEYGIKRMTAKQVKRMGDLLRSIVAEYDSYLRGDVYGYQIKDKDGNDLDSCWGYIGYEYAVEAAKEAC